MEINYIAILLAAASTLPIGFIWFNPKVFGTIWMRESGTTEDMIKGGNMALIHGTSFLYAILMAFVIMHFSIHQFGIFSLIEGDVANAKPSYSAFMSDYGDAFRTFKHGAFHGFILGLFFGLPLIGANALYERRSFKYTLVTSGYWIVCFAIMGGIICSMK